MDNLIEKIDSINEEMQNKVSEYKNNKISTNDDEVTSVDINADVLTKDFLEAYPKRKPFEEIISIPIKF